MQYFPIKCSEIEIIKYKNLDFVLSCRCTALLSTVSYKIHLKEKNFTQCPDSPSDSPQIHIHLKLSASINIVRILKALCQIQKLKEGAESAK